MYHLRPDVHQVGDALSALPLGIAFEQLAHLEEEHHEDRLRELRLGSWHETDGERTDGGHRHEKVLVQRFAVQQSFCGFLQRLEAYQQVGHEIYEEQLPGGQRAAFLDNHGYNEEQGGNDDGCELRPLAALMVMMMASAAFMLVMMLVMMMLVAFAAFVLVVMMMLVAFAAFVLVVMMMFV